MNALLALGLLALAPLALPAAPSAPPSYPVFQVSVALDGANVYRGPAFEAHQVLGANGFTLILSTPSGLYELNPGPGHVIAVAGIDP